MSKQEWDELINTTVTVNGVEKRLGDCTADELKTVLAGMRRELRNAEQKLTTLQAFAERAQEQ